MLCSASSFPDLVLPCSSRHACSGQPFPFHVYSAEIYNLTDINYITKIWCENLNNVSLEATPLGPMLHFHMAHSKFLDRINWKRPKSVPQQPGPSPLQLMQYIYICPLQLILHELQEIESIRHGGIIITTLHHHHNIASSSQYSITITTLHHHHNIASSWRQKIRSCVRRGGCNYLYCEWDSRHIRGCETRTYFT